MRPPRKAIEQIRNYCERTQCRKCIYGEREKIYGYGSDATDYVACKLQMANPCDWDYVEDDYDGEENIL